MWNALAFNWIDLKSDYNCTTLNAENCLYAHSLRIPVCAMGIQATTEKHMKSTKRNQIEEDWFRFECERIFVILFLAPILLNHFLLFFPVSKHISRMPKFVVLLSLEIDKDDTISTNNQFSTLFIPLFVTRLLHVFFIAFSAFSLHFKCQRIKTAKHFRRQNATNNEMNASLSIEFFSISDFFPLALVAVSVNVSLADVVALCGRVWTCIFHPPQTIASPSPTNIACSRWASSHLIFFFCWENSCFSMFFWQCCFRHLRFFGFCGECCQR